ncbi:hypothetical protein [Sphingomonas sp. M1-B02]|uniref:hypothetical protein n=1 Tax=Sphingomonas sp. M1-B02 TaxID=3114300 RepID=UPI00224059A7|nr:hypothetical protein [Sphingomonas sp. S6-11]UZK64634.1 hypothetical protein OKW87_08720 [Sphingomonas sp. S6-11]
MAAAKKPTKTRTPSTSAKPAAGAKAGSRSGLGLFSLTAIAGVAAAGLFGLFKLGKNAAAGRGGEHVPTDLMGDVHPDGSARAIEAFRPDPTAPIPASERDAFRPALAGAQAPTLVAGQANDIPQRAGVTPA